MNVHRFVSSIVLLSAYGQPLAASELTIEEIIVTAQRIEENAGKVPIAINAFDETMIEDRRLVALEELKIFVPNLHYTTNDTGDTNFSIRGVGSLVSVNDGESGVSLHLNEVPLPPGQPPLELFDVARVEVLRGPQGTLYGRNATGGVINVITQKPDFDGLSGYADLELGDFSHRRLRGALNVPVGERLAVRVAALALERDGYTDNLAGGQVPGTPDDVDGRDLYGARATLTWRVTESTELSLLYERFEEDDDRLFVHNLLCRTPSTPALRCEENAFGLEPPHAGAYGSASFAAAQRGVVPFGAGTAATGLNYRYPRPGFDDLRSVHVDFEPVYELDQDIWQLRFRHEMNWGALSLDAGHQDSVVHRAFDADWSVGHEMAAIPENPAGIWPVSRVPDGVNGLTAPECDVDEIRAGVVGGCVLGADLSRWFIYNDADEEREHWFVEAKLRTDLEGRFDFLVGANYQSSDAHALVTTFDNQWDIVGALGSASIPRFYPSFFVDEAKTDFESYSMFGEVYVDLSPGLKLTAGLRYNKDEKKVADRFIGPDLVDLNSFEGFFGQPTWVRFLLPPNPEQPPDPRVPALLDLYGATEAVATAFASGNLADLIAAWQLVPPVPTLNEARLLNDSPTNQSWNAWTGRLTLDWQVNDELLLYGSYSRGYKPGGFNPGTTLIPGSGGETLLTYDREDVDSLEVGLKGLFFDRSLSLNVAAFFADYQDLQLSNLEAQNRSFLAVSSNVDTEFFGAELEVLWRPKFLPRAQLELGYAYLDTKVTNATPQIDAFALTADDPAWIVLRDTTSRLQPYVARTEDVLSLVNQAISSGEAIGPGTAPAAQYANGIPAIFSEAFLNANGVETLEGLPVDFTGNRLPEAPEHALHLAAAYTWDVFGGALTARWDYYWQDHFYMTAFNRSTDRVSSWDQHNAMLIFESGSGRWALRAWVRNITDGVHITGGRRSNANLFAVSEPRSFGASFRYNFGDQTRSAH